MQILAEISQFLHLQPVGMNVLEDFLIEGNVLQYRKIW
jgi:hypothetical protein